MGYRDRLPQLDRGMFLTDGGLETCLNFYDGLRAAGLRGLPPRGGRGGQGGARSSRRSRALCGSARPAAPAHLGAGAGGAGPARLPESRTEGRIILGVGVDSRTPGPEGTSQGVGVARACQLPRRRRQLEALSESSGPASASSLGSGVASSVSGSRLLRAHRPRCRPSRNRQPGHSAQARKRPRHPEGNKVAA